MKLLSYINSRTRPDELSSLQDIRNNLLNSLLVGMTVFGSLLYGLALIPVLENKMYNFPVLYSGIYVWLILITFVKRIPFRLRAGSLLFLLYLVGVINLYVSGFNLHVAVFLMGFVVMTSLFFDLRSGLAAFLLSSVSITIMGFYIILRRHTLPLDLPQLDPMLWVIGAVTFLLMTITLIVTLTELVHDLKSNLIKSQNLSEKLRLSNETLLESEARYRMLVEMSPDLVTLLNLDGDILMANKSGLEMFKYESLQDVVGKSMLMFFSPEHHQPALETIQETIKTGSSQDVQGLAVRRDGVVFWAEFSSSLIVDAAQNPQAILTVGRDITKRKKTEQLLLANRDDLANKVLDGRVELQRTTERLKELVDRSPVIIHAANLEENYPATFCSENIHEQLGYSPEDFTGAPHFWAAHVHPQDLGRVLDEIRALVEHGKLILEYRFRHKNGEYRWMKDMLRLIYAADGQPLEMVGSWIDITDRKQIEEELGAAKTLLEKTNELLETRVSERTAELFKSREQLRELARKVVTVQEDERRRISRELHDQAGQVLIGLRFSLEMIRKEIPPILRKLRQHLKEEIQRVDQTIEQVRSLAYSLRPPILDLMGIDMGIKGLCQEFSKQAGLKVDYKGVNLTGLSEEVTICLYRFVQEALTNVLKHAYAHKVDMVLEHVDGRITLSVKDDGRGVDQRSMVKGLGIQGMEERIRSVGGRLEIQFTPQHGSNIKVVVPWNENRALNTVEQVLS